MHLKIKNSKSNNRHFLMRQGKVTCSLEVHPELGGGTSPVNIFTMTDIQYVDRDDLVIDRVNDPVHAYP